MTTMVSIVNLLYLLKKEPQYFEQLYNSGCFYNHRHLRRTITTCMRVGLVTYETLGRVKNPVDVVMSHSLHKRRWNKILYFYYITTTGHAFLSYYTEKKDWQIRKANNSRTVKQVAVS